MINITLSDLDRTSIYPQTLQTIEDFCEEYHIDNDFGIISTANQEVIDFLSNYFVDFCVEFAIDADNQELTISYLSHEPMFQEINLYDRDRKIIQKLTDNYEVSSDFKSVRLNFHVKPKFEVERNIRQKVVKTVYM
ncbi:MAG: hypothetical protein IJT61_00455 [Bacteroidales bacterium]|nr:hypothetical protein [Bacteroidales bacterium]MBQ7734392.1 hypothetical protein [Bacteroidales bacterium]